MLYLSYLIIQGVLMGATIDYSILFTSYYRHCRTIMGVRKSLAVTYYRTFNSILTSGLIITLVPLVMGVLLALLQDRRRPIWPWLLAQLPVVMDAAVGINERDMFCGFTLPHYWQLGVIVVFVVYYIFAVRQYGRWLLDNYADLERKQVWQSLVFMIVLLVVYIAYTSNAGELMREYLSQVITIVIIVFLLWRVETLQELENA